MSIDDMREGGDTGPAIEGEDATATMLIKAMRYEGEIKMPPDGKLSDDVIRDFEKWIEDGALDPRNQAAKQPKPTRDFNAERQHWAFQPLSAAALVSPVANSSSTIDTLIDQSLATHGLARSQPHRLPRYCAAFAMTLPDCLRHANNSQVSSAIPAMPTTNASLMNCWPAKSSVDIGDGIGLTSHATPTATAATSMPRFIKPGDIAIM